MKTKLGKKIERLAGTYPRRECPCCGHRLERASRYCNMCGKQGKAELDGLHKGKGVGR